mmetsp:Transcript_37398/g.98913  ORF Transcript_37398/g.98913 Transcript_37398/m.98913 type:complete len:208 (-) Transcript_37398:2750-3373(-)
MTLAPDCWQPGRAPWQRPDWHRMLSLPPRSSRRSVPGLIPAIFLNCVASFGFSIMPPIIGMPSGTETCSTLPRTSMPAPTMKWRSFSSQAAPRLWTRAFQASALQRRRSGAPSSARRRAAVVIAVTISMGGDFISWVMPAADQEMTTTIWSPTLYCLLLRSRLVSKLHGATLADMPAVARPRHFWVTSLVLPSTTTRTLSLTRASFT